MRPGLIPALCLALALAGTPAWGQINKCKVAGKTVYQDAPCPAGSTRLAAPETPLLPSAYESEAARLQANEDIATARAMRKREEQLSQDRAAAQAQTAQEQEKQRAKTAERNTACNARQESITKAAMKIAPTKSEREALLKNQAAYDKDCGPR